MAVPLDKLRKLCGMLGSAYDGERAAAGALADKLLREHGLRWEDVLAATPSAPLAPVTDKTKLAACLNQRQRLNAWELKFCLSLRDWNGPFTDTQQTKLNEIHARVCAWSESA